jgi:hypothetical protein
MEKEKIKRKIYLKWIGIIILIILATNIGYFIGISVAQTSTITIEPSSFQTEASYIIFIDGNYIKARNGKTGNIDYSGVDAGVIIQNVINALTNGGKIFIKRGEYDIDLEITIAISEISIEGEGKWATVLKATGNSSIFHLLGQPNSFIYRFSLKSLTLRGTNPSANKGQYGIKIDYAHSLLVEDVHFSELYDAIHVDYQLWDSWVRSSEFSPNIERHAFYLHADADWNINLLYLTDDYIASKGDNIYAYRVMGLLIHGCYFYSSNGHNIYSYRQSGLRITGCDFDGATENAIEETNYIENFQIINSLITGSKKGIVLTNIYDSCLTNLKIAVPQSAIEIIGGSKAHIIGISASDSAYSPPNTYSAIKIDADGIRVIGCLANNPNVLYSIEETSGHSGNEFIGNHVTDNKINYYTAVVKNNIGYRTENGGTATFSGDGTKTEFQIPHYLAKTPKFVVVTAGSTDARGNFYVVYDAYNIFVVYATAPPAGTNNVVLRWYAEV